jgi:hypothetical protein
MCHVATLTELGTGVGVGAGACEVITGVGEGDGLDEAPTLPQPAIIRMAAEELMAIEILKWQIC